MVKFKNSMQRKSVKYRITFVYPYFNLNLSDMICTPNENDFIHYITRARTKFAAF